MNRTISQTGADAILSQFVKGLLTADEYHQAAVLMEEPTTPVCLYCPERAVIGKTCAGCVDKKALVETVHQTCPIINLALYNSRPRLTAAIIAALERAGRIEAARLFSERAAQAPGMNAVAQIARDYVRLESRMLP